jgi:hypothetical protein
MTTALEGGEWSAELPGRTLPRERPSTHCTGGWVGPRAGLDWCGKSRPHRDSIPDRPAHSHSLYRLRYPAHIYVPLYNQEDGMWTLKPAAKELLFILKKPS